MHQKFLRFAIPLALLCLGLGGYLSYTLRAPDRATVQAADPAVREFFALNLPDLQAQPQKLAQWQGRLLLVNFWATWCKPCVEEMPELSALQQELGNQRLQILGLGIDTPSNLNEFASKLTISYPLLVAGMRGSELSRQLGNLAGGLPYTVLISADGQVVQRYLGRLKIEALRADLAKFSAEKSK